MPEPLAEATTVARQVAEGQITISSRSGFSIRGRNAFTNVSACCEVLYIFQFAAISGLRIAICCPYGLFFGFFFAGRFLANRILAGRTLADSSFYLFVSASTPGSFLPSRNS